MATYYLIMDSQQSENFCIGTPQCWDDEMLKVLCIDDYRIYHIRACMLPKGQFNRITDHKKIWGIRKIAKGIYDGQYDCTNGRTYFGVYEGDGEATYRSAVAPLLILIPKSSGLCAADIFEQFKEVKYDFSIPCVPEFLSRIQRQIPESIIIQYEVRENATLTICYDNMIFNDYMNLDWSQYPSILAVRASNI